jgi:ABC-type nitrate/sulfonate/bicarbonate transport system substrate-binding protein
MKRLRFRRSTFAVLALVLVAAALAACGSSSDDDAGGGSGSGTSSGDGDVATVHPIVLEGSQLFPITVMQTKGIADRYRLKVEPRMTAGPEAVYTQMQGDDFEIAFGAWAKAVQLAAAGTKVVNTYSMLGYDNQILVPEDSDVRTIADLKGKKIGLFGGPGSGTTLLFRLLAKKYYGFDPQTEAQLFYGAPGLLTGQLRKGQIDAVLLLDPLIQRELTAGGVRSIAQIGEDWQRRTGQKPLLVAMQMNSDWARENPDVARRFVAAFAESLDYIKDNPDVWTELAASVGLRDRASADMLREDASGAFVNDWSRDLIDEQFAFGRELVAEFGESRDFPSSIPPETFTTEYAPARPSS